MSMHRFALAVLFCSAVLAPSTLTAQTYPSSRFTSSYLTFPAGSSTPPAAISRCG